MKKLKALMVLSILGIVMFVLAGCGSTKIDLNKYMKIEAVGYNTEGELEYRFDREAFEKDYSGKIECEELGDNPLLKLDLVSGGKPEELIITYCVKYKADKETGLKNGDKVKIEWKCDEEMAEKYFGSKLEFSDITYTVKGLK